MIPSQITERHLRRKAVAYLRQSTEEQVQHNTGSTAIQRDLPELLRSWGWPLDRIVTIDEDLGISGSVPDFRLGFKRLVDEMKAGTVGLVVVSELSRLGRNPTDVALFMTTARQHDVLVAHGQQVVDLGDPNAEFVTMILQFNAVREQRARTAQFRLARVKKAQAGIAITRPPVGYVCDKGRNWIKDPHPRVRDMAQLVFDKFVEFGTVGRVVRLLVDTNTLLPHRGPQGQLKWVPATRNRVHRFLIHPAYAGVYVYGRTVVDASRGPYPNGKPVQIRRPIRDWIQVPDHHEGYITQAQWAMIQERLAGNRNTLRGPLGRGEALVQGLLRCAVHGRNFHTKYPDRQYEGGQLTRRARYACEPQIDATRGGGCVSVKGKAIDSLVEAELFRVLVPASVGHLTEMGREALREHHARVRAREDELYRARQAVDEAERAFDVADTDQVHLRRRLSQRLEERLRQLHDLQATYELHPLTPPLSLDGPDPEELRGLVGDLPALWRHPAVTPEERKSLVRLVIRQITVMPTPGVWTLTITWMGGAETRHQLLTPQGVRQLIAQACGEGLSPKQIADRLGQQTAIQNLRRGTNAYSAQVVQNVMTASGLKRPVDLAPYQHIQARLAANVPSGTIREELNAQGLRHPLGRWTQSRLQTAVKRLRAGRVVGIPPVPPPVSIPAVVRTLHETGLTIQAIVAQLNRTGIQTPQGRSITYYYVWQILRRERVQSHGVKREQTLIEWLTEWAPRLTLRTLVERANALGLVTRSGNPWKDATMRRKLLARGLPTHQDPPAGDEAPL